MANDTYIAAMVGARALLGDSLRNACEREGGGGDTCRELDAGGETDAARLTCTR